MAKDIASWLEGLGLGRYAKVFAENEVDLDVLPHLSEDDLKEMGLPLGVRRRLQLALDASTEGDSGGVSAQSPMDRSRPSETSAADDAERRQLTLMFCDLAGSTELSTKLDAEDLRVVIKGFQDTTTEEVERYGGYVAKYMGDGVLAYFGYPKAHEDDAERAINAGIDIVDAVVSGRGNTGKVDRTTVRVGIATGSVVVGDLIGREASQERAVVGQTPNLAARLQGLAEPNTVIIDAATQKLVGGLFELEDRGVHSLKGFADPLRAWGVVGRVRAESRFAAARSPRLTGLVGREEELELLLRRWRRAQEGEGQLVLISGEPGIGKSRLVHAALERISGEPHTRVRYQCSPFHTNTALYPAVEQLERAAGFDPSDTVEGRLEKLEAVISMAGRSVEDDAPLLADLLSIPTGERYGATTFSPQQRKQRVIEALAGHLAGLSERQPVLFVLEDAHWMDPTTHELLDLVVERLRDIPVLTIVTHRPEFDAKWAGRSRVTVLTLNRLGRRDSATLAAAVSRGLSLPESVLDQIITRTDGIPLFVEEFTRAAMESNATDQTIDVPTTLKDALEARLDQLDVGREVAQIGAALGRTFDYPVLEAVCGQDEAHVRRALDELVEAQLLFVRGEPPEASYTFKHALVQDTAHDSMLRTRQVEVHARIAAVLEAEFSEVAEEEPELLAHHLTQAEKTERAITYWQRAGEIAARRFAVSEAISHFTRAIDLVRSRAESPETKAQELALQVRLAPVYLSATGFGAPEAARVYRRALELGEEIGDKESTFIAHWGLSLTTQMHSVSAAVPIVRELLERSAESGDDGQRLQACHSSWTIDFFQGELEAVRSHTEEGMRLYDRERHASHRSLFGGHDPGACCGNFLSMAQFLQGHADTALATMRASLSLAEELQHPFTIIISLNCFSILSLLRREPDDMDGPIERSIELAAEHGVSAAMWSDSHRGYALGQRGQPVEGLELIQSRFYEGVGTLGQEPFRAYYIALMAELCGLCDRAEEGLDRVAEGLELIEQRGTRWCEPELHRIRGELLRQLDRSPTEIEACFRQAMEIATDQGALAWRLRAATSLARLWVSKGETTEARQLLAPIYDEFTEGFDIADLKDAKALLDGLR